MTKSSNRARPRLILAATTFATILANFAIAEELEHICRYCNSTQQQLRKAASSDDKGPRYAPDRQIDVLHIKIDVTPDFEQRTVAGTTTIKFVPIATPLSELRLDAVHLEISDVRGSSAIAAFTSTDEDLTIVFEEPIAPGTESSIEIDHAAEPTKGFYFRTPEMGYPAEDTHVFTQGETHEARHWFPCYDYPNERSSTEVICSVPKEMVVLSNGERISETYNETTKLKSVRWLQEKPHVNYLICLVAGYFDKLEAKHRDVPLAFYSQPTLSEHAANSFVDTAPIMEFFEEEIGVPFPWNKYYQVTIRDFVAGGMENTTLTTLTHGTIFASETENLHSTRSLDAHEMAHQWFGDYVTCKDWSHLWLNEGFATYYSALYEGQKMGPDALLYTMYKNANNRVIPSGKNDTRPIVYKGYSSPDEQFDYRSYPKGAWVLHMLRSRLGKELYRQCIKTYLERNALTSVVTEELNEVIEEISGRSFDPFFDQWVYHARHPDLKIEYRWQAADKLAKVTIRQTQKTNDDVMLFEIPTKLRFDLGDGEVIDHAITIDQASHDFYVSLSSAPKVVRFDPEYTVLADISFSKPDAMLLEQLKRESDVIGRIYAVEALAKRKTKKSVAALKETLNDDAFYGVRLAAASALGKHASDDSFEALLQSTKQEDARVRREVVKQIGRTYRDEARELLMQVIENDSNPGIAAEALRAIAKYQSDDIAKLIVNSLKAQSFRNEVASAAISAIRDQADSSYADSLLAVLKERQNELGRRTVGSGMDVLARLTRDADDKSEVREFLMGFVADSKSPLRSSAIRALGTLGDEKVSATLRALSGSDREGRIASAAKSALGKIQKETKFVPREVSEMRKMLNELKQSHAKLKEELESIKKVANAKQKAAEKAPENAPAVGKEEPSKEVAKSKDVPKETASVGGAN